MQPEEYKAEIDRLCSEPDRLRRKLRFVGLLSGLLEPEGVVPILVGGTALEFYTFGEYSTADVDLVLSGREKAAAAKEGVSDFLMQAMKKREEMSKGKGGALRFSPRPEKKRGPRW